MATSHYFKKFGYKNHKIILRTLEPISPGFARVKFQLFDVLSKKFYMVAYVTKGGLGPEPEFALSFRSFFRWSGLSYGTPRICSGCTVHCFRGGRDSTRVAKCYPASPLESLNLHKVFDDAKI